MKAIAIVGCGFVADLYMRSLKTFPDIQVVSVFDHSKPRLEAFSEHWGVNAAVDMTSLMSALPDDGLLLNLTNPSSHFDVNLTALTAGHHVFCEKPLALSFGDAKALFDLANKQGLQLGSAPSSVLGEAAQTLGWAIAQGIGGTPRLIYAELDDGYVSQAPIESWVSESGARWPYEDEFKVGCTLEHAGYYLSWLIAYFGPVSRVLASSAKTIPDKRGIQGTAPDFSVAVLHFENGPVVRLTCSIAAPHDHRLRVIGEHGVIALSKAWDNAAPVKYHRRMRIRRRLLEHPIGKRLKLPTKKTHPKLSRKGAAAMNFALGPAEMIDAISTGSASRISGEYALHLTEVTLAIQNSGLEGGAYFPSSQCKKMEPMPWAR